MDYLEYTILKNRRDNLTEEEKAACIGLLKQLVKLCLVRRRESVRAMEEYANDYEFEKDSPAAEYYKNAVAYVVEGRDSKHMELYLSNDLMFYGADTFQGYLCYLIMKGILSIQSGDRAMVTQEKLLHCIPLAMREEANKQLDEVAEEYQDVLPKFQMPEPDLWKPKPVKNPFLSKAVFKLSRISDERLENFVQQAKPEELMMLLEYVSADLRKTMLGYVSEQVKEMLDKESKSFSPEEVSKLSCSVMSALKK